MTLNEENDYSPDAEKPRPRRTPEGSGPGGEGAHAPGKAERALKALGSGNALHERNGLSSHGLHRSTFGDGELNCRVRHGTG